MSSLGTSRVLGPMETNRDQKKEQRQNLNPNTVLQRFTKFNSQPDAEQWLKKLLLVVSEFTTKNSICAVFDIDGTILRDRGDDKLPPLCNKMLFNLFQLCRALHVPIYIITARPEGRDQRKWTIDQLKKCGYPPGSYVELRMMPILEWNKLDKVHNWNFSDYKYKERQRIVQNNNKTIILNCGDQWTDLMRVPPCSNSAEESVVYNALNKLPNSGIYVGSLVDLSWISVKLPH